MPLVFGGAPLVNVLYTMYIHPPKVAPNPLLYVGFLVTAIGAGMVLYFKPKHRPAACVDRRPSSVAESSSPIRPSSSERPALRHRRR